MKWWMISVTRLATVIASIFVSTAVTAICGSPPELSQVFGNPAETLGSGLWQICFGLVATLDVIGYIIDGRSAGMVPFILLVFYPSATIYLIAEIRSSRVSHPALHLAAIVALFISVGSLCSLGYHSTSECNVP